MKKIRFFKPVACVSANPLGTNFLRRKGIIKFMNQIAQTFGQRVRYYRKQKGFSQEKLAEHCDLHPTYIGQLERGEKNATLETVMSICRGLEIAPARLFENLSAREDGGDYPSRAYDLFMRIPLEKQRALFELLEKAAAFMRSL